MFRRTYLIALIAAGFALAGPAFADGTGKGPTHNAPAPLTPQSFTIYPNQHATPVHTGSFVHNTCQPACGHSGGHLSHSGLPTNPRQTCCGHSVQAAPLHFTPAPAPQFVQAPVQSGISLSSDTIASMNGGVGTGVNDVFVGGFGGGSNFGGNFGARSAGVFARNNVAFARSVNGLRGNRGGSFKGGRGHGGRRGGGKK